MDPDNRPSPEELLEALKQEEAASKKGQLKIFIGMAAGVGKTYAMLKEAQNLKKEGVDVVIGVIDTHERQETAALLKDLDAIPPKLLFYKDKEFQELDVDAIIQKHPELVLVDELAHNNIPGSKHPKRWQDVLDILDNGINVYTTLNVQHIESLNDIVKGITEISVRETVPDLIIEKASSIQLIDLTPDELLERLREGKVYLAGQSQIAIDHFFQKDRLTALREIVLRYAADKIDRDLRKMMPPKEGVIEWKPREKFLVAISHSPHSQKLIRATRRLAASIDAPWIALHIDNGKISGEKDIEQLSKNLALARDLGAEVITIHDPNIAEGIKRIANQRGITQIILGRPPSNPFLNIFRDYSLLDTLATECKDIDIHIIRQEKHSISFHKRRFPFHTKWSDYLLVLVGVLFLTGISVLLLPFIGYKTVGSLFLFGIVGLSLYFKKGPIFFAAILYGLIWGFFFIPSANTFSFAYKEDIILLFLYFLTALTVGTLLDRAREQKELLAKSEKTTMALYEIVRNLASGLNIEEKLKFIKEHLSRFLDADYTFIIKQINNGLLIDENEKLISNEKEKSVAIWAFENGKEAGWSTETLPFAQNLYIPLKGLHEVMGVLVFKPKSPKLLTVDERNFLYTVCEHVSSYLERSFAREKTKQHDHLRQVEKIHKTILNRFSHALEGPIVSTRIAINKLKQKLQSSEIKKELSEIDDIEASFEIFIKILNNISAMTQLSEDMVPLKKDKHSIREVIEECCDNAKKLSKKHIISVEVDEALGPISFDYYLMRVLIYNLILNAIEHSPSKSLIEVEAKKVDNTLVLSVSDCGKGIPEDQIKAIFEKFYRIPDEASPGIGLGLAIAKTIAELHHGTLKAENLPQKGAKFSLVLPL